MREEVIHIRPFRWADLHDMAEMINRAREVDGEAPVPLGEVRRNYQMPDFEPENESFVAVTLDNEIVGSCRAMLDPESGMIFGGGVVHPAYRGQGIGTRLLRATDERIIERAMIELPPEMPITIRRGGVDSNASTARLLTNAGYHLVRYFYDMVIDLNVPLPPVTLPDGIKLRPFVKGRDARAVYDAYDDAYCDHWGYVSLPFAVWRQIMFDERFDPDLWIIAVADETVVGLCLAEGLEGTETARGWVDALAVRREWRGRGLGAALLRAQFAAMQAKGAQIAALAIDADWDSGATTLFERAGMRVHRRYSTYCKPIRDTVAE